MQCTPRGGTVSYFFSLQWDHFHPLWVKSKPGRKWEVTQARARALRAREEKIPAARALLLFKAPAIVWAPIQPYCCAEISRAPFGSLRLPAALQACGGTPLLFWVQIHSWINAWPRLKSPLAVALWPLSPTAQYPLSVVLFSRKPRPAFLQIPLSFFCTPTLFPPLVYMLIVVWSTLIIPMVIF